MIISILQMRQLMQYLNKPITVSYAFKRRRKSKSLFADVRPPTVPPPMIVASGVFLFDMLFIKKTEYSKITIRLGGLLKNEKELRFKSTVSHFPDRIGRFSFLKLSGSRMIGSISYLDKLD
uniref:Uncharacterized protein n=1 Tax=Rhizophagus irregularis (strain DAOM 181602 / DAOM 197198 / MUCL 43194) TaxID=747089 RepID=U9T2M2_RHIID